MSIIHFGSSKWQRRQISYFLKCRIWICNKKNPFSLGFQSWCEFGILWENWTIFEHSCTGNTGYKKLRLSFVTSVTSTSMLKKSPIFSKNAKFTLRTSKEKLNFLSKNQILHFKYVWNLSSLTLAWFILIHIELQTK